MMKRLVPSVLALALAGTLPPPIAAQDPQPAKPPAPTVAEKPLVPLELQILVTRFQGEKKVSSLPFTVSVNANDRGVSSLRMGAEVPVPAFVPGPAKSDGKVEPITSVNYRPIGTNIDCTASSQDDGRFNVFVRVDDSSVYKSTKDGGTPAVEEMPVFRSFKSEQRLLLRDGQTREFTAATDRVNGEVVKIQVTLRVVK